MFVFSRGTNGRGQRVRTVTGEGAGREGARKGVGVSRTSVARQW